MPWTSQSHLGYGNRSITQIPSTIEAPHFREAWNLSATNKFGRLVNESKAGLSQQIEFTSYSNMKSWKLTEGCHLHQICLPGLYQEEEQNCTLAMLGGNLINCTNNCGTPTVNLLLIKIFFNSVISTNNAKFANADMSNFYLMTPLCRLKCAKIWLDDIPKEIRTLYNLHKNTMTDGWIYIKITKGMYGLPQAGGLANELLEQS